MLNYLIDLVIFLKIKCSEKKYNYVFFNENNNTFQYLKEIIKNKSSKKEVLLLSIKKSDLKDLKINQISFKTQFFYRLFFLTLKIKILYTTTVDLENSFFLKSKFQKNFYIYIQHSTVSLSKKYGAKAFNEFDAVQVINKSQYDDLQDINRINKRKIRPIKSSYKFFDVVPKNSKSPKVDFLIAPTWNTNFYELKLHLKLIKLIEQKKMSYELRPHFMSFEKKELKIENNPEINYNLDNLLNFNKYKYLISDWSGLFIEFAIINKCKPFLLNTNQKALNDSFNLFKNKPIEVTSKQFLAHEVDVSNLEIIFDIINDNNKSSIESEQIFDFYKKNFYFKSL